MAYYNGWKQQACVDQISHLLPLDAGVRKASTIAQSDKPRVHQHNLLVGSLVAQGAFFEKCTAFRLGLGRSVAVVACAGSQSQLLLPASRSSGNLTFIRWNWSASRKT